MTDTFTRLRRDLLKGTPSPFSALPCSQAQRLPKTSRT